MRNPVEARRLSWPDPVVTANLYASGLLDEAVCRMALPFQRALRESDPSRSWRLWLMRYSRGGEHLKLRVHAPPQSRSLVRRHLVDAAGTFFAELGEADPEAERIVRPAPPIDAEDEEEMPAPDRTLLETRYRRSQIVFGGPPYLADDGFLDRATVCLDHGCTWTFAELEEEGAFSASMRQLTFLRMLIAGLGPLGFSADERAEYLLYYRDWLVRFPLLRLRAPQEEADRRLAGFEKQAAVLAGFQETLGALARGRWEEGGDGPEAASPEGAWERSLVAVADYLAPRRGEVAYQVDPFASHFLYPPLIKLFLGVANPLGLGMAEQARIVHLLLRATAPERAGEAIVLRRSTAPAE